MESVHTILHVPKVISLVSDEFMQMKTGSNGITITIEYDYMSFIDVYVFSSENKQ